MKYSIEYKDGQFKETLEVDLQSHIRSRRASERFIYPVHVQKLRKPLMIGKKPLLIILSI